jgi:preprotein translocase subunit SecD
MRLALGLGTRPTNSGQPSATSNPAPASHDAVRQRRRFAQDGDVPVVMLHRGRDGDAGGENKLAALTADLREERASRSKVERALEDANALISSLKTKLKHAEMSLEEKLLGDSEARAHWDALLLTEREARQQAETRAADAVLALSMLERKIEAATKLAPAQTAPVQHAPVQHAPVQAAPVQAAAVDPIEAPAAPDLFGELDAASPAPTKRRMSRKTAAQPDPDVAQPSPALEQVQEMAEDGNDKPIEWWLPSFRAARKTPSRRKRTVS